jgi:hypothetical protein
MTHRCFDEDGDGNPANDGAGWHSHWVVLVKDGACGPGLKVRDVSPGIDLLPPTAPGLPIALDSPGMSPILNARTATITVPVSGGENASFDAVTAQLQVNQSGTAPLLCVTNVHEIGERTPQTTIRMFNPRRLPWNKRRSMRNS